MSLDMFDFFVPLKNGSNNGQIIYFSNKNAKIGRSDYIKIVIQKLIKPHKNKVFLILYFTLKFKNYISNRITKIEDVPSTSTVGIT